MKTNTPTTDQMHFLSKHVPVSVSVCTNVEGFYEPKCFVDISSDILISKMMSYFNEISSANLCRLKLQHDYAFHELEDLIEKYSTDTETDQDSSDSSSLESTNENSLSSKAKTHFFN